MRESWRVSDYSNCAFLDVRYSIYICLISEIPSYATQCKVFFFFGVHPLPMTTTSCSTLMTQHEEDEYMCKRRLR